MHVEVTEKINGHNNISFSILELDEFFLPGFLGQEPGFCQLKCNKNSTYFKKNIKQAR
jgi:hypothetical protein